MDTAKVQQAIAKGNKRPTFASTWAKVHSLRFRFWKLQAKLILPYLVLTLILAAIGVFIITNLVVDAAHKQFHASMLDASGVANDSIVSAEKTQLDRLRFLIFTEGMAQSMYEKDSAEINNLMGPVLANSRINLMTAIDLNGKEIVTFGKEPEQKTFRKQEGVDFSGVNIVNRVLRGETDDKDDKFTEIIRLEQGPILFTAAPVRDANQQLVGAMMVGTYLDSVLTDLKNQSLADIIVLDRQGRLIRTTLTTEETGFLSLIGVALNLNPDDETMPVEVTLNERPYQVAYSPFIIRNEQVGWIGVVKSSQHLVTQANTTRNLLVLLFTVGTIAFTAVGYLLASNISRPILRLRDISQDVAAGDYNHSTGLQRADEIGALAASFDEMTRQLKERKEEAERLYAEALQRNKELADINARLEATQLALIQSEKLASIGQLTAGIVHDVKNPFAVIMGMAEVLADDDKMDEATKHGLKVIRESAIKGNTIVSDLLKFARQSQPEMRYRDLRETVQTSMRLTAYLTRKYNTTAELPDMPLMVKYDAQQVEQVLINMIHNAVQAMPNRGALQIALKQVNGTAQISVQDTGSGIAPEHLKRIFDPFFTTKPEGEGTGLGLSVSYGIIANHGGRIEVQSEVGVGTTFTIILPITSPSLETGENNL